MTIYRNFSVLISALVLALCVSLAGCHSHHIDCTVENRTGAPAQLVEVDYPSASFGVDTLTPGQIYPYRFQVRGSGQLKVQYTGSDGKQVHRAGPLLNEGDQGILLIVLLPGGNVRWTPSINQ